MIPVYRPAEKETDEPEHLANGFSCAVKLGADSEGARVDWQEQRLVVRSLKQASSQEKALDARLDKAEKAIAGLNRRGRKRLDEEDLLGAAGSILERHGVAGLLAVDITRETQTVHKRAYGGRAAETVAVAVAGVCLQRPRTEFDGSGPGL